MVGSVVVVIRLTNFPLFFCLFYLFYLYFFVFPAPRMIVFFFTLFHTFLYFRSLLHAGSLS